MLYIGNTDGSLWTDMIKRVPAPTIYKRNENGVAEYSRSKNNPVIASMRPIAKSQWLVAIELSKKKLMENANQFLYWLILIGSILLIVEFLFPWLLILIIITPLKKFTEAPPPISAVNFSTVFPFNRSEE